MEKTNTDCHDAIILLLLLRVKELWNSGTQIVKTTLTVIGILGIFGVAFTYLVWLLTFPVPFGAVCFYATLTVLSIIAYHYNPKARA